MRATAIIGANFGDEGKGLLTDFLVSKAEGPTLVVRHNGGAQAGHTVVTPSGQRHVFHHFGSGTLLGAATYLSRFFVLNPTLWRIEQEELLLLGIAPRVYINPRAQMTTPYDMLLNQELETNRGNVRHGSCGLGIHETVLRENVCPTPVFHPNLQKACEEIRSEWIPERVAVLGLNPSPLFFKRLNSDSLLANYLEDVREMLSCSMFASAFPLGFSNVFFEGAQGLLLDQDHPYFPYVTHSKTGLANVRTLCEEAKIFELTAVYVTRAYLTRHGAGPFPTEDPTLSYSDLTNVPNPFQKKLRFGRLDPLELNWRVREDAKSDERLVVSPQIALTCLDQVPEPMQTYQELQRWIPVKYASYGPTRATLDAF